MKRFWSGTWLFAFLSILFWQSPHIYFICKSIAYTHIAHHTSHSETFETSLLWFSIDKTRQIDCVHLLSKHVNQVPCSSITLKEWDNKSKSGQVYRARETQTAKDNICENDKRQIHAVLPYRRAYFMCFFAFMSFHFVQVVEQSANAHFNLKWEEWQEIGGSGVDLCMGQLEEEKKNLYKMIPWLMTCY